MTYEEARDLVTDEMLDAAQDMCNGAFRVDCERIIAAALMVFFNDDDRL